MIMVSFRYVKASHLDASAAVKLVLQERGSEHLSSYFANRAGFYITSVCLAEALGVFKRKRRRDELSEKQYLATCYLLLGYLRSPPRIRVDEIELSSLDTFAKAEEIARRHKLDLSDSLQLISVKHGRSSSCVPGSKPSSSQLTVLSHRQRRRKACVSGIAKRKQRHRHNDNR
jgi:uncharacterized protein